MEPFHASVVCAPWVHRWGSFLPAASLTIGEKNLISLIDLRFAFAYTTLLAAAQT